LGLLSVLGVLSREYVGVVLFVGVVGYAFLEKRNRVLSVVALVPALVVFVVMVSPTLLGLVWNYVPEWVYASRSYPWVVQDAFVIFAICYLGLLPFVVAGLRRDKLLGPLTGWLLLGSFGVLVPFAAVPGYQRWLMLLVFPFCAFAVWGFERLRLFSGRRVWGLAAVVLVFIVVGSGYSTGLFSYVGRFPNSYVAVDLVESSVRWDQIDDIKAVLSWLDENAASNSSILVEDRFYGWVLIYLERANGDVKVVWYGACYSPFPTLEGILGDGFSQTYLIWYAGSSLAGFHQIHAHKSVSIFRYDRESLAQFHESGN